MDFRLHDSKYDWKYSKNPPNITKITWFVASNSTMVLSKFLISIFKASSLASKSFNLKQQNASIQIICTQVHKWISRHVIVLKSYISFWDWTLHTWHPFLAILFPCLEVNYSSQLFAGCSARQINIVIIIKHIVEIFIVWGLNIESTPN